MATNKHLIFLNGRIKNWQSFLEPSIIEQIGTDAEIVVLNPNQDILAQISSLIVTHHDLQSLHLISYQNNALSLGSILLTQNQITTYQTQLDTLGKMLFDNSNIEIFTSDANGVLSPTNSLSSTLKASVIVDSSNDLQNILNQSFFAQDEPTLATLSNAESAANANVMWPIGVIETSDAAAGVNTIYRLAAGQTLQGQIATDDTGDWYQVSLVAGQTYTFAAVGTGVNYLANPLLNLYNSSGAIVTSDDNSGPRLGADIQFTALSSGDYFIEAKSAGTTGGQYGLSVTQGDRAHYDVAMGAGAIYANSSWSSTPGTGINVTYGFRQNTPNYSTGGHPTTQSSFTQLSTAETNAVRAIMGSWSEASNITFTEVNPGAYTDSATILFQLLQHD